ncbi:hypothetical protein [Novosphingobium sp. MBES04]|uniref:hypothetical protein n=1 Tax=Novosphingobium sp. MBES04 TaxID=1206458 RepID=UPI0007234400|nr:hypothetical protein MBENS4_0445 [Novosphingobium sp. MBES04]
MKTLSLRKATLGLLAGAAVLAPLAVHGEGHESDGTLTVIRGGTIYDGASMSPVTGDVVLRGDAIVYVGPARAVPEGARVVDATGKIVRPASLIRTPMPSVSWRVRGARGVSTCPG